MIEDDGLGEEIRSGERSLRWFLLKCAAGAAISVALAEFFPARATMILTLCGGALAGWIGEEVIKTRLIILRIERQKRQ